MMNASALVFRTASRLEWKRAPGGGVSSYRRGLYCGPGWGFTREDVLSGRIAKLPEAIDAIDAACQRHDQCYHDRGYFTYDCNLALSRDLVAILTARGSTPQQRLDAVIMAGIFGFEALTLDLVVDLYRGFRDSFETMFVQAFSMEAVIQRHLDNQRIWGR
jgi:hypothetical protein